MRWEGGRRSDNVEDRRGQGVGMGAAGAAPLLLRFLPAMIRSKTGRVILVAPHMQAASQSLLIRAELRKPDGCIRPFQYVQTEVAVAQLAAARTWRVPPAALVRHQGLVWMFVEAPGGFRPVAVTVLYEAADAALVTADLPAATKLAVKGVSTLKASWLGLGGGQ